MNLKKKVKKLEKELVELKREISQNKQETNDDIDKDWFDEAWEAMLNSHPTHAEDWNY